MSDVKSFFSAAPAADGWDTAVPPTSAVPAAGWE